MNKGIRTWNKATKIIPGGNGLLSKRPFRYLPNLWPTYYKKSKGLNIWDLDNKKYIDFCQMGIGTCILGYANKFVDTAGISRTVDGIGKGVDASGRAAQSYEPHTLQHNLLVVVFWLIAALGFFYWIVR
jgi:glutamate-1-semialdehyde aminotransferase